MKFRHFSPEYLFLFNLNNTLNTAPKKDTKLSHYKQKFALILVLTEIQDHTNIQCIQNNRWSWSSYIVLQIRTKIKTSTNLLNIDIDRQNIRNITCSGPGTYKNYLLRNWLYLVTQRAIKWVYLMKWPKRSKVI